jgi:farnesyl-diphosphate farnesyltransferase
LDARVPGVKQRDGDLLTTLLRDVSRSFYLTLRVLPGGVRRPIGLAYLLARATDTIADTEVIPLQDRLSALEALRSRILGTTPQVPDFSAFLRSDGGASGAERILLNRIGEGIAVLDSVDAFERDCIREVIDVITGGQILDLTRFDGASKNTVIALPDAAALDDYTYRVAGCVGTFWTRICRARLFPSAAMDEGLFLADAVRFGKGLQLVNILRDLPKDLSAGRCYLPGDDLSAAGLKPSDLLDPRNEPRMRPLYDRWLATAEEHLDAGWRYTRTIPRDQIRVRLACAWPVLIGIKTLNSLRNSCVLEPGRRVKISRGAVRGIIWATLWRLPWSGAWDHLFEKARFSERPRMR